MRDNYRLLSVVMPVYNERTTIDEIVRRVLAVPLRVELIVVDDGSTDGTSEILDALQRELTFTLLRQKNAGKGAALRRGFAAVTGDLVVVQDADLEYSPEEYPQLIELICDGKADVVYGSRFLGRHRAFLFAHYVGNKFLTLATNVLYNTILTDMETLFTLIHTAMVPKSTAIPKTRHRSVGWTGPLGVLAFIKLCGLWLSALFTALPVRLPLPFWCSPQFGFLAGLFSISLCLA